MTWRAYYLAATGELQSEGSGGFPDTLPPGWTFKEYPDRPDIHSLMWDNAARDFIARPPKVLVDRLDDLLTVPEFLTVWNSLNATRKTQIRTALIRLLGNHRYRNQGEPLEIP